MLEDHTSPTAPEHPGIAEIDEIVEVARSTTSAAGSGDTDGTLVVVARTNSGEHRAVSSDGGPLRAAVSVAVASGHERLWDGAVGADTVETPVRALPEVIRTTAEAQGVTVAHVGAIIDDSVAAVAVWFDQSGSVADGTQRREVMQLLAAAAERQREFFARRVAESVAAAARRAEQDSSAGANPTTSPMSSTESGRAFDPTDPHLDADTGLATSDRFQAALDDYDSDEATLVVVDLDGFSDIVTAYGESMTDAIVRTTADRLMSSCRADDLVARIGPDTFAILFADAPRSVGLQVAKRLLDTIAQPLGFDGGPDHVTATVALAHQFGLVDTEELMETAEEALQSGKRAGSGRLVIAS